MRRSISWLPGNGGCCREGIVFWYGVVAENGRFTPGFAPRVQRQLLQQAPGTVRSSVRKHIIQRIDPFPGFQHF